MGLFAIVGKTKTEDLKITVKFKRKRNCDNYAPKIQRF